MGGNPAARGSSNADSRGSSYQRRKRKQAVLDRDGNGEWTLCVTCPTVLDFETLTLDRITPGCDGGTYELANVQPQCERCAARQGGFMGAARREANRARAFVQEVNAIIAEAEQVEILELA